MPRQPLTPAEAEASAASSQAPDAASPPLRVLIVSNLFPPDVIGGAEIAAERLATALARRGHHVKVLGGYLPGRTPGWSDTQDAGVVHRIPLLSLQPEEDFIRPEAEATFRRIASRFRPDVVHFHNLSGLGAPLVRAARDYAAKVVCTLHDYWGFCRNKTNLRNDGSVCVNAEDCALCSWHASEAGAAVPIRLRRDLIAWSLDQADALISPSQYLAARYRGTGLFSPSIRVISNGLDLAPFETLEPIEAGPATEERPVAFLYVGSFGRHKGLDVLWRAAKRLHARPELRGRWSVTCIGDGPEKPSLLTAIVREGLSGFVRLEDALPHAAVPNRMAKADALISASVWEENEPIVLLEAAAAGLALIAPRIGGVPELVADGVNGSLFEPGDDAALALAMERYVTDAPRLARHKAANLARRPSFGIGRTVDEIVALYRAETPYTAPRRPIVLCAGQRPGAELSLALHRAGTISPVLSQARFLPGEWLGDVVPPGTALLWLLSGDTREEAFLFAAATEREVPVLVPRHSPFAGWSATNARIFAYSSLLDAVCLAAAILDGGTQR
ncbi:MAG: glycosyltransferase [Acetobacteraceae bacterium]|nr:glycosyltransferase [Acetobacteraceae bacterium]